MSVNATVASVDANSYLTVAEADSLAADDFGPEREKWLDAGLEEKEQALKRATREIDGFLRSGWARYDAAQRLLFPRSIDIAPAGAFVPWGIKQATYEQATYLLANVRVLDSAATRRARGLSSASEPNNAYTQREPGAEMLSAAASHYLEGFRRAAGSRGLRSVRMSSGFAG